MRERLVVAFVALAVVVVAVFLVERAYTTSGLIEDEERREVARSAEIVAAMVSERGAPPTAALLRSVLVPGDRLEYVGPDGEVVEVDRREADALDSDDDVVETRELSGGGAVTYTRHAQVVEAKVADQLLPLVLIALVLLGVAAVAAVWLARRLSRPFDELADIAGRVGRGDFDVETRHYGVPEADAVASALRSSAQELDALVRRERDFTVNASHELRTPMTALRLELEDLALAPGTPPQTVSGIGLALGQLDRLSASIAGLLDASRENRLGSAVEIDLAALVRDTGERWGRLAPTRTIQVAAGGVVAVRVPAGSVTQVLDVLIGNAVAHGQGEVAVRLEECEGYAEVSVADQGQRARADEGARAPLAHGAGGLARATQIALSFGGQLRLAEEPTTTFTLAVPVSRPAARRPQRTTAG